MKSVAEVLWLATAGQGRVQEPSGWLLSSSNVKSQNGLAQGFKLKSCNLEFPDPNSQNAFRNSFGFGISSMHLHYRV